MTEKEFEEMNKAYRSKLDYNLDKTKPIILMLDGRSFGKFTKKFDAPFDINFVNMMNDTAKYLCANIQNATYAFVQSDEISIYLSPCEGTTEPWFGGRISKILSVAAGMASSKFMQLYANYKLKDNSTYSEDDLLSLPTPSFDCKAWNAPTYNEVIDWFVYRQKDCIRNSKQQFAQSYASHKELLNKSANDQIEYVKINRDKDWNILDNDLKYGRLITKSFVEFQNHDLTIIYNRSIWVSNSVDINIENMIKL